MSQLYLKMEGEFYTNAHIAELLAEIGLQISRQDAIKGSAKTYDEEAFCDWSMEGG